jgi:hypothetical protein
VSDLGQPALTVFTYDNADGPALNAGGDGYLNGAKDPISNNPG